MWRRLWTYKKEEVCSALCPSLRRRCACIASGASHLSYQEFNCLALKIHCTTLFIFDSLDLRLFTVHGSGNDVVVPCCDTKLSHMLPRVKKWCADMPLWEPASVSDFKNWYKSISWAVQCPPLVTFIRGLRINFWGMKWPTIVISITYRALASASLYCIGLFKVSNVPRGWEVIQKGC